MNAAQAGRSADFAVQYRQGEAIFIALPQTVKTTPDTT